MMPRRRRLDGAMGATLNAAARGDQALAVIESYDPGFYQSLIDALTAAAGGGDAGVITLELPIKVADDGKSWELSNRDYVIWTGFALTREQLNFNRTRRSSVRH